jgi:hypothetical protein
MFAMKWRLFILSILVFLSCETLSFGQDDVNKLLDQKLTVHLTQATLLYVLETLAVEHRIPVGLERSSTEVYKAKFNIDVKEGTLRDVLDSITQQEQDYRWEVRDGVINFTPIRDRYGFVVTLLDTCISRFAPAGGIDKFDIRNNILQLPEVSNLMASNRVGISRFTDYPYHRGVYANDKVDLSISNTNVRGILNKVVRDSEHKIWVVEMAGNNKNQLIISF